MEQSNQSPYQSSQAPQGSIISPISSGPSKPSSPSYKTGRKNTSLLTTLAILAIAGLGFGGFALAQSFSKDAEIKTLKKETAKQKSIKAPEGHLDSDSEEPNAEPGSNQSGDASNPNAVACQNSCNDGAKAPISEGYIYLPGWGVKLKLSDDLVYTGHKLNLGNPNSLCVYGTKKGGHYFPDFANLDKNQSFVGQGCITRHHKDEKRPEFAPPAFKTIGDYKYIYMNPQSIYSQKRDEASWEADSMKVIEKMYKENLMSL